MEDELNKIAYEAPVLDELHLCPVVQGGASQFGEDPEDDETRYNQEEEDM